MIKLNESCFVKSFTLNRNLNRYKKKLQDVDNLLSEQNMFIGCL